MNRLSASLAAIIASASLFVSTAAFADDTQPEETKVAEAKVEETKAAEEPKAEATATESTEVATESTAPVNVMAPAAAPEVIDVVQPIRTSIPTFEAPSAAGFKLDMDSTAKRDPRDRVRAGALVGVGFPRPIQVEAFVKLNRTIGVGAEYSFLPDATIFGADLAFKGAAADLRVFPFKNGVFVGLRAGRQWLDAKASVKVMGRDITETASASTWFINPRIGVLHTTESGITVGMDIGVQIPIAAEYTRGGNMGPAENQGSQALRTAANALGNKLTPSVDLLRIGFVY